MRSFIYLLLENVKADESMFRKSTAQFFRQGTKQKFTVVWYPLFLFDVFMFIFVIGLLKTMNIAQQTMYTSQNFNIVEALHQVPGKR